MRLRKSVGVGLSIFILGGVAAAQSIEQMKERKEGDGKLAEGATQLADACGVKILVSYDWASEASAPGKPAYQGPLYCKSVVDGLASACSDLEAKPVIAKSIKAVKCRIEIGASKRKELAPYGGAALALKDGTLDVAYDWSSSNIDSEARKWATTKMTTPGPNGAVTVEAITERTRGEKELAEATTKLGETCGGTIKVTYDFSSEKGAAAKPAWQGFLYCKGVVDGITSACSDADAKPVITKKITALACRYEAGASKHKELNPYGGAWLGMKGTTLNASYDWSSSNIDSETRKWVMTKL